MGADCKGTRHVGGVPRDEGHGGTDGVSVDGEPDRTGRCRWADRGRHASHSSARHLLSGAVVYLFKAKSSHTGAWPLGEKSASKPWYSGAVGESIGSLQGWQVNGPAP